MWSSLFGASKIQTRKFEVPAGFADYYINKIKPQAEIYEQKRLDYLKSFYWRLPLFLIFSAVSAYIYLKYFSDSNDHTIDAFVIAVSALGYWTVRPIQAYKNDIKKNVFPIVFQFFGKDLSYSFETSFDSETLKNFGIIPYHNEEHNQDDIKGNYKDVSMRIVQCKFITGSGKNRRRIFSGPLMLFDMNKTFNCKTIVRKDAGMIGNLFQPSNKLEPVHLEDPKFESIFNVYSDDQVQARYLLTTSFMENLLKLNEIFGGKSIEASFFDDRLLLKIDSNQPWFNPDTIFKPCNFANEAKMILQKMQLIFNIIDILKLDQNTGL